MKSFAKICLVLLAAVTMAAYSTQAQTDSTTTTTPNTAPAKPKAKAKTYAGTIASVDADGKTISVTLKSGTSQTVKITSKTRIKKDGVAATLADVAAGDKVHGSYHTNDAGDWSAVSVLIGEMKKATPPPAAPADK